MPSRTESPEVIVIGAGPAGTAAAIALARAGRPPLVLEARRFPRDKVCGGCLSGPAMQRLGALLGPVAELPGIPAGQVSFVLGARRLHCDSNGRTRLISRPDFDDCLATAAARAGATLAFGEPATLEPDERGWRVRAGTRSWRPQHVLVACGLGRVAHSLGVARWPSRRTFVSQSWRQRAAGELPRPGDVELHWLRGGYVGLATSAHGSCHVATAVESAELRADSPLACLARLNPNHSLLDLLAGHQSDFGEKKGVAGFPWRPRAFGLDNLLLLGDAAGYEEPFTGDGIGQALLSGMLAAEAVLAGGAVLSRYTALMRRQHLPARRRTRLAGALLRWPPVRWLASAGWQPPALDRLVEFLHVKGGLHG